MGNKENIQKAFNNFNSTITLSGSKRKNLIRGRNGLRTRIKNRFAEEDRLQPKFYMQGSFAMKTTVNPIGDKEYDVDDGVYIQGYSDKDMSEWPSTTTVHKWVKDAVHGYTSTDPIDKNTCVRVVFAENYHVDLPIYISKNENIYLAHKENGWSISDPKEFTDWFIDKIKIYGEQVRSDVKFLKAWKDYKSIPLKGLEITILVGENFYKSTDNDLKSLIGTISNINNKLKYNFTCKKPVRPFEDLFEKKSEAQRNQIIDSLEKIEEQLNKVANEEDVDKINELLVEIFGDRFPKIEKNKEEQEQESYIRTSSPAILRNDGHSA